MDESVAAGEDAQPKLVPAQPLPGARPPVALWPPLPVHVLAERDENEARWGLSYCRRCGRSIVNDDRPAAGAGKPCRVVPVTLRRMR